MGCGSNSGLSVSWLTRPVPGSRGHVLFNVLAESFLRPVPVQCGVCLGAARHRSRDSRDESQINDLGFLDWLYDIK